MYQLEFRIVPPKTNTAPSCEKVYHSGIPSRGPCHVGSPFHLGGIIGEGQAVGLFVPDRLHVLRSFYTSLRSGAGACGGSLPDGGAPCPTLPASQAASAKCFRTLHDNPGRTGFCQKLWLVSVILTAQLKMLDMACLTKAPKFPTGKIFTILQRERTSRTYTMTFKGCFFYLFAFYLLPANLYNRTKAHGINITYTCQYDI